MKKSCEFVFIRREKIRRNFKTTLRLIWENWYSAFVFFLLSASLETKQITVLYSKKFHNFFTNMDLFFSSCQDSWRDPQTKSSTGGQTYRKWLLGGNYSFFLNDRPIQGKDSAVSNDRFLRIIATVRDVTSRLAVWPSGSWKCMKIANGRLMCSCKKKVSNRVKECKQRDRLIGLQT